jgi:hypothetical protein
MKMRVVITSVFLLAVVCAIKTFVFWGRVARVDDVTKSQTIILSEQNKPQAVYGIEMSITGHIDGSATIQRSYADKKMYAPLPISGNVNLRLGGDWYKDRCLLIYSPSDVKSGNLKIRYAFRTL